LSKIVVLSRRNIRHPLAGGAAYYQHEIFRRLAHDHKVIILADGGKSRRPVEEIDGISYVNLRGPFIRLQTPLKYLANFSHGADLLVDHADVAIPWLSPLFASKPRITIVHQLVKEIYFCQLARPWADIGVRAERAIYKLYSQSRIVASSGSAARELVELGIPSRNISVIKPGHESRVFPIVPLQSREMKVCCVSRLVRYKGIQYALRAFRDVLLTFPQATFKIAGSGPYQEALHQVAESLGIDRSVEFLGRISQEDKFQLLSKSRAAVFPSIRDGFGISVIEANSVGTPVVGWNVPGPEDSIIDGRTGLLSSFPDEHAFAANLTTLLSDDATWERLSENARRFASNFSWERAASDFSNVVDSSLNDVVVGRT
jgi:glycosyltransferase involved in cell wall biosynthesis